MSEESSQITHQKQLLKEQQDQIEIKEKELISEKKS